MKSLDQLETLQSASSFSLHPKMEKLQFKKTNPLPAKKRGSDPPASNLIHKLKTQV